MRGDGARKIACRHTADIPLSFIRTVTVGFGFAPNLLTPPDGSGGRSRARAIARTYRRWGLPPRPENDVRILAAFGVSMQTLADAERQ
jgi:hypothetical protein